MIHIRHIMSHEEINVNHLRVIMSCDMMSHQSDYVS